MSGGRKSLEILANLERGRLASLAAARASRRVGDLDWRPAQVASIARDDQRATWQSGHVHAVLSDGQSVIAGSQTGGVWLINPIPSPSYRDGYRAIPLSDRWDTPNVQSLAYGPDGTAHVFAGCGDADSLFLIELQAVSGATVVKQSDLRIPLPDRLSVYAIVVIDQPRRVIIGTDGGVFWSEIPISTTDVDSYVWQAATGLPQGSCGDLARGPGTSVAAAWAAPGGGLQSPAHRPEPDQLFVGDWAGAALTFSPASVPDIAKTHVSGFVLTSCAAAPQRMYTAAMGDDSTIRCVLRSDNGGHDWYAVAIPANAGDQGYHDRAIAVSPYRPDIVALGWVHGPYLSTDGGWSWTLLTGAGDHDANGLPCHGLSAALHDDVQALCFPKNSLDADYLVIASDGGVVMTRDLGHCFDSDFNRALAVLQFYGPGHVSTAGTLSVSSRIPGLLAGGTQDNGNITLHPDADAGAVWHPLVGGDGGLTRFVDPLGALLHTSSGEPRVRMTTWNPATRRFNGAGDVVHADGAADGIAPRALEAVFAPTWRRGGQLLYACAASTNGDVHGLFANADGTLASFLRLTNVGSSVSAVASLTGAEIVLARTDGTFMSIDTMTGLRRDHIQDDTVPTTGAVSRIEVLLPMLAYALKRGRLLRFDGAKWTALPAAQTWVTFTAEQSTGRLFAATDLDVFHSVDGGQTWLDASLGLPSAPHVTDLRIGNDADGGSTLYMTTYGRSAWRARITLPPDDTNAFQLPPQMRAILLRIIEEGGALVRVGDDFTPIGARQPARDVVAALVIDQIAQQMSPEAGREIRREALRQIERVVARTIQEIG